MKYELFNVIYSGCGFRNCRKARYRLCVCDHRGNAKKAFYFFDDYDKLILFLKRYFV